MDKRLQMAVKAGESAGSVGARGYSRIALCESQFTQTRVPGRFQ